VFQNHTNEIRTAVLYISIFPFVDGIRGNKISDQAAEMCPRLEDPIISIIRVGVGNPLKYRYTFPEGMDSNLRRQQSSEDYSFRQQVAEENEWE
jgi:hypothetical protein